MIPASFKLERDRFWNEFIFERTPNTVLHLIEENAPVWCNQFLS